MPFKPYICGKLKLNSGMGRKNNGLDFGHTCPRIDKAIGNVKDQIDSSLAYYIRKLCPLMPDSAVDELSRSWALDMYNDISPAFESVRETNEDMRKAADAQISDLCDDIENLNDEIYKLRSQD